MPTVSCFTMNIKKKINIFRLSSVTLISFAFSFLRLNAEDDKMRLEKKIEEAKTERDSYQVESEELKMQIHILEDRNDSLQNQLHETNRRFKESKQAIKQGKLKSCRFFS